MEISYLGNSEYLLRHKKSVKVLIRPTETKIESESGSMTISGPGEYEIKGVLIAGFKGDKKNIIYTYDLDGIRVAFLGEVKQKLTDKQLDWLDGVDVLLVSVEGADIVKQVGPSWAISSEPIKGLEGTARREKKLVVNKLSLPEETELVIL